MEGERKVVVATLQFACSDSVSGNVETAERLVRAAHKKGANIVLIQVTDELFCLEAYMHFGILGLNFVCSGCRNLLRNWVWSYL
ncbi:N-carbamoylputrescine amidase [Dendrobium catenatum]|uniref:N-carbamoylputrescine amidase n=1 Tax=Dendrobium catenatum TaxID=906689 RepID=A0A2I0XBH9_9ASPA|nr:N-carbamoylputrescine amidase [Dendrobium catenatum]